MTVNHKREIIVRPAQERGFVDLGWLKSYHTFSFGDYYDPQHMGFRSLRVINDDAVLYGGGFGMHPHRDMEILSYVIEGSLQHKDSLGNESIIQSGQVQLMSAGKGILHSEWNPSPDAATRFLQIWIAPQEKGLKPSYQDITLSSQSGLTLLASPTENQALLIHQDAYVHRGILAKEESLKYTLKEGRGVWVQMIKGVIQINGHRLKAEDGVSVECVASILLEAKEYAEFLLFDLNS